MAQYNGLGSLPAQAIRAIVAELKIAEVHGYRDDRVRIARNILDTLSFTGLHVALNSDPHDGNCPTCGTSF